MKAAPRSRTLAAREKHVTEWNYVSGRKRADPFNEVELDVVVRHADGDTWRVPAFWAGGQEWRVRFLPPKPGHYEVNTSCSDTSDPGLHGVTGGLDVEPREGDAGLFEHGSLRVARSQRTFEHADGTPFFWLGDTWWMGLCGRWSWPDDFQLLAADRAAKGFTVIQIVAGLYPDMPGFDPRGANEAGFPWEPDYARINPAYFDMADLRIRWLVRSGLAPCIVGAWGYYLPLLGAQKMKQHWRYLVARWGAYPAFWCLAGEAVMPYYLSKDPAGDKQRQKQGWTEIARYVREIDPYHHPVTLHSAYLTDSRDQVEDAALVDFSLIQGGGTGYGALGQTVREIAAAVRREPAIPVVQGESCYENNMSDNGPSLQRFLFWSNMLAGAAGHTYGADGIWQINSAAHPYGASPHGCAWGDTLWEEAMRAPGGTQTAIGKRVLASLPWHAMRPHQEWTEPAATAEAWDKPYAAGIPGRLRVIYYPINHLIPWQKPCVIKGFEPGVVYRGRFVDPRNGAVHDIGEVRPMMCVERVKGEGS